MGIDVASATQLGDREALKPTSFLLKSTHLPHQHCINISTPLHHAPANLSSSPIPIPNIDFTAPLTLVQ
jgi:hypothetical protein